MAARVEVVMPVSEFLDANHVQYVSITHSAAFTAQGIAALTHIPGKELAKTVIVNIDGVLAMVVLPASLHVDLDLLRTTVGAKDVRIAPERDFQDCFPGCELGAMPPFGNLYDMAVYVDEMLTRDDEIAFNAGSHYELIKLAYDDFEKLVKPVIVQVARVRYAAIA
jgi:Ala-tRNA(Pro) deacylase